MNPAAAFSPNSSSFNLFDFNFDFNLNFPLPSPRQDADLIKYLSFVPGLKEILLLRQVHALEHATVWILGETKNMAVAQKNTTNVLIDDELLSGFSTEQGFYLYGDVNINDLRRAVILAQHRLINGEWNLAVHPRCGTNLTVSIFLTAGLVLSIPLLLLLPPVEQLITLGLVTTATIEIAPELGSFAQRYLTTSVPFNLRIGNIFSVTDTVRDKAHFVQVYWRE